MKKLTLLLSALMITGAAAFAHEGKSCCKDKKENCHKEAKACKKGDKNKSCCSKKSETTAKK